MQVKRRKKILELIENQAIDTQQGLTIALQLAGFDVAQATVSRDIRELGLTKRYIDGSYRYAAPETANEPSLAVLRGIFVSGVTSVAASGNLIVIKTLPGLAPAAMSAVDARHEAAMLGTLAGDDTGLIVMKDAQSAAVLADDLNELIEKD